jgi:hypothetical protein
MNQKYQHLLSLHLKHEYYYSSLIPNFGLHPLPETLKFLKNHRLLLKQKDSTFHFLYEGRVIDNEWNPIISIDDETKLIFGFKINDSLFQTKTAVPFHVRKTEKLILNLSQQGEFDGESALTLSSFQLGALVLDNTEVAQEVVYTLQSISNGTIIEVKVKPGLQALIELEDIGMHTLSKDGELIKTFFWSNYDDQYDGFIELTIGKEIEQDFSFTFQAKKIFWKYLLIPKYMDSVTSFQVKEESDQIIFEEEEQDELKDGILHLISTEKIKIQEKYGYNLTVQEAGEVIKKHISFPSLNNIKRCSKDVNKYMLTTYLNL